MPDQTASLYADITKSEEQEDGSLLVTGIVSDETLDVDQQIADGEWLKSAIPTWFRSGGNVREMHQPIAAGVATEYAQKDSGSHHIVAHVIDANSVKKVKAGVLRGFSIGIKGPRVIVDKAAKGGRIIGGSVIEVSLVDRPANPNCTLVLAKAATAGITVVADHFDEKLNLVKVEELTELPTPGAAGEPLVEKAAPAPAGVGSSADDLVDGMDDAQLMLFKRDFDAAQRKRMAANGKAMPGGGFPIANAGDLENAIRAVGRAKDPEAAKAHIKARAKALGRSDLIPDTWKAVLADLEKSVASDDEMAHDPETLLAVRNGILACLIAECMEMQGGESELYDISTLYQALALFTQWWGMEAYDGEAPSPTETKAATSEETTTMTEPEASPTEVGSGGNIADKTATPDTVKSVVAEVMKGTKEQLQELLVPLLTRLETVEKMAAPGGPARMRTQVAAIAARAGDELRAQIASLSAQAATIDDSALKGVFVDRIKEKQAALDKMTSTS